MVEPRRIKKPDISDSKAHILWFYYTLLPFKYLPSCDSHQWQRGIDGKRDCLWVKDLSFHIQIARKEQIQDLQIQGGGVGNQKKKKITEIANSLREEKVIIPRLWSHHQNITHNEKRRLYCDKIKDIIKCCS